MKLGPRQRVPIRARDGIGIDVSLLEPSVITSPSMEGLLDTRKQSHVLRQLPESAPQMITLPYKLSHQATGGNTITEISLWLENLCFRKGLEKLFVYVLKKA